MQSKNPIKLTDLDTTARQEAQCTRAQQSTGMTNNNFCLLMTTILRTDFPDCKERPLSQAAVKHIKDTSHDIATTAYNEIPRKIYENIKQVTKYGGNFEEETLTYIRNLPAYQSMLFNLRKCHFIGRQSPPVKVVFYLADKRDFVGYVFPTTQLRDEAMRMQGNGKFDNKQKAFLISKSNVIFDDNDAGEWLKTFDTPKAACTLYRPAYVEGDKVNIVFPTMQQALIFQPEKSSEIITVNEQNMVVLCVQDPKLLSQKAYNIPLQISLCQNNITVTSFFNSSFPKNIAGVIADYYGGHDCDIINEEDGCGQEKESSGCRLM